MKSESLSGEIIRQSFPILALCIIGEVIAGVILFNLDNFFRVLPGIVVLIPVVMGTRGNILGIFGSRITSALHLGSMKPIFRNNRPLNQNAYAALFLSAIISILSGIAAHYATIIFGFQSAGIFKLTMVVLIASVFSDMTLIAIAIVIAFISFRRGIDPDNILLPLTTTISDAISTLFLVLAVKIII